jgi:hypothetical protein
MRAWTAEQAGAFQIAARNHRLHALYVLPQTAGMQQGELLGLTRADVDLSAGPLAVRRSLRWRRSNGLAFTEPKTARGGRTIHLARRAIASLRAHEERQAFDRHAAGSEWTALDLVICIGDGSPLSSTNETKQFQRVTAQAGLPALRFPPSSSRSTPTHTSSQRCTVMRRRRWMRRCARSTKPATSCASGCRHERHDRRRTARLSGPPERGPGVLRAFPPRTQRRCGAQSRTRGGKTKRPPHGHTIRRTERVSAAANVEGAAALGGLHPRACDLRRHLSSTLALQAT